MSQADAPAVPEPVIVRHRRPRLSLVWLVPVVALLIGASLVVRSFLETGPRIEIEFLTAEGLEAGKTEVRFKEVVVGRVHRVHLHEDRKRVIVHVQLDRSAAALAVEDTNFWVVRPRIGVGGVSGLGTLLSGAYIGVDAGRSEERRTEFVGLEAAPYVLRGEPGASFVLKANDLGSLDVGSPIYYRRTRVGRVVGYTLDAVRDELQVKVFVEAPYQRLVTADSRFWNVSGVDIQLNANGLSVSTQSVASVLAGGIAFEQRPYATAQGPAPSGTQFQLFSERKAALAPPDGEPLAVRMVFEGSSRGLSAGAPVDFLGVDIGVVRQVDLQYNEAKHRFPVQVLADIYPDRLGAVRQSLQGKAGVQTPGEVLQRLVDAGLRAQLRSGNVLTGQLYVSLDFFPKANAAAPVKGSHPMLTLPTVPGTLAELQSNAAEILQKMSKLPLDDMAQALTQTLKQTTGTMAELTPELQKTAANAQQALQAAQTLFQRLEPDAQKTMVDVQRALAQAQTAMQQLDRNVLDGQAPLQRGMEQTLLEVQRAAQSLRVLADTLQRHPEALLRGTPADAPLPTTATKP